MYDTQHKNVTYKHFSVAQVRSWVLFIFCLHVYLVIFGFLYFGCINKSLNARTFTQALELSERAFYLSHVQAGEMTTSISVSATVLPGARMTTHFQASQLTITPADVRRGYVDVDAASNFSVLTNSRNGYTLEVSPIGYIYESVKIDGLGASVEVSGDGGAIVKRALITPAMSFQLSYRFILRSDVQAGVYSWPIQLSVRALS